MLWFSSPLWCLKWKVKITGIICLGKASARKWGGQISPELLYILDHSPYIFTPLGALRMAPLELPGQRREAIWTYQTWKFWVNYLSKVNLGNPVRSKSILPRQPLNALRKHVAIKKNQHFCVGSPIIIINPAFFCMCHLGIAKCWLGDVIPGAVSAQVVWGPAGAPAPLPCAGAWLKGS